MSLYKDASLVMIPSAYKDGKLYSIRPTDGDGDFTFSRGSNLAATRVDVNGLIEKGRENILLQSNQFDTTWSKPNSTLAQGFSGYDGSNNAWKWSSTAAGTTQLSQGTSGVSGIRTLSLYAKAGSRDVFSIWVGTGIDFNLTTGQTAGHANASMESVGNGWWRCSYFNDYGTLNPYYVATSAGEFIYIMNAQAEQGLVATDYIETGATTAQAGILEDMPRLDYSGGASCPSLLLEPQRTNIIESSEYLGDSNWINTNLTITHNQAASPSGLQNAGKIVVASSGARLENNMSITGGTNFTISAFVKKTGSGTDFDFIRLQSYKVNDGFRCWFNITDGTKGTEATFGSGNVVDSSIENYGDGWYRISVTGNIPSSFPIFWIVPATADDTNSVPVGSEYYMWGAQAEVGSYPTSYIPTYGSSVTRSRDFAEATFAENDIAPTGGTTLFLEFETSKEVDTTPNTGGFYLKNNAGTLGYWGMSFGYGDRIYSNYQNGSTIQWDGATPENTRCKVAFQLVNGGKSFLNGTTKATTSVDWSTRPLGQLELQYGTKVKQAILFPTILTDSECIALTTL